MLHSFNGADGRDPSTSLIDVNGTLYGTTEYGGLYCTGRHRRYDYGCGTFFSITSAGKERLLHTFGTGSDGKYPGGLLDVNGTLYGTTAQGGDSKCSSFKEGCGTVYSISTTGGEHVLHSFGKLRDGTLPSAAGLIDVRHELYGVTDYGGKYYTGVYSLGFGTVYSITTTGTEHVLHSFGNSSDGQYPIGLLDVNGTLYGTTNSGGRHLRGGSSCGCGTVFALRP